VNGIDYCDSKNQEHRLNVIELNETTLQDSPPQTTIAFKKKIFRANRFKPPVPTPLANCTRPEFLVAHWRI
jgi:hypothetical protein